MHVADRGSFAAAAQALHLAAPTVTLHVAELESRLGTRLLVRARSGVTPTRVGLQAVARARRLLAEADALVDELRAEVGGRSGRVRVGASTGALAWLLPQALQRLQHEHPDLDVQVAVLTSAESLARLAAGTLDLGLVALPQTPPRGVRLQPWRRDPVRAFVPASWQAPRTISAQWLADRPLILNDGSTRLRRLADDWFARAGLAPQPRIELNFNDAIRSLVAAGYGAGLLPHEAGAPTPDAGQVTMHALRPALWRPLGLAWREGDDDRAVLRVLEALQITKARTISLISHSPATMSGTSSVKAEMIIGPAPSCT